MPDDKRDTLHFAVTAETKQALKELAEKRTQEGGKRYFPSDIAREAVEEYLADKGYNIKIEVDRGGYRGVNDQPGDED
jgi:hypothetical protein